MCSNSQIKGKKPPLRLIAPTMRSPDNTLRYQKAPYYFRIEGKILVTRHPAAISHELPMGQVWGITWLCLCKLLTEQLNNEGSQSQFMSSCSPPATCVYQKEPSPTECYHAKPDLLVKIVRRLHCSSTQPCFLPDSV